MADQPNQFSVSPSPRRHLGSSFFSFSPRRDGSSPREGKKSKRKAIGKFFSKIAHPSPLFRKSGGGSSGLTSPSYSMGHNESPRYSFDIQSPPRFSLATVEDHRSSSSQSNVEVGADHDDLRHLRSLISMDMKNDDKLQKSADKLSETKKSTTPTVLTKENKEAANKVEVYQGAPKSELEKPLESTTTTQVTTKDHKYDEKPPLPPSTKNFYTDEKDDKEPAATTTTATGGDKSLEIDPDHSPLPPPPHPTAEDNCIVSLAKGLQNICSGGNNNKEPKHQD